MNFGDIELMDPPSITKGSSVVINFKTPIDQIRVRQVMEDEEVDISFFLPNLDAFKATKTAPSFLRNHFEALNLIHDPPSAPEKKTTGVAQASGVLLLPVYEKAHL